MKKKKYVKPSMLVSKFRTDALLLVKSSDTLVNTLEINDDEEDVDIIFGGGGDETIWDR